LSFAPGGFQPQAAAGTIDAELKQHTQELLDAVAPGRADVWRALLADRIIHVDENGVVPAQGRVAEATDAASRRGTSGLRHGN